jgi:hypothetical protein
MTNLQALQAMLEYENDNLLTKALTDRSVSGTATYAASAQKSVELAAADIYLILLNHPEFKEGSKYVKYTRESLIALRRALLIKHGVIAAGGVISVPQDSSYQKLW